MFAKTLRNAFALTFGLALIWPAPGTAAGPCTNTAKALFTACGHGVQEDWSVASARCINLSDKEERTQCSQEAGGERREGDQLCRDQRDWRLEACDLLGEGRYHPPFEAALFNPDPVHPENPNPYFPLAVGNQWTYDSGEETNTVEVLDRTKLIDGVRCIVVLDQVFRGGVLHESTNDWFAFANDGNVWYCGEETAVYDTFAGDHPALPELVSIEGSFKAGRDGDKPGIIFLAEPTAGAAYFEEFSLDNAEDATEILSATYAYGHDAELDELVPAALAQALCSGDCVVTRNFSLLEPGVFERKYYAPGLGVFLEVEPEDQVVVRLVHCNFDARCATLPQP